jgi:UDP:flavonoid glycosyltransferase YjiC (YdhE family)
MFSTVMGKPQPDWPVNTAITGFAFHDSADLSAMTGIRRFIDAGPPPIVFTRGSAAVYDARDFFAVSRQAAQRLGQRALFTVGNDERNHLGPLPEGMLAVSYAPFSAVFPAASVVVHQCGIGTCGQALAAGRPMLMVPHAFDQPDNAARLERLGVGLTIDRGKYVLPVVERMLGELLKNPTYQTSASAAQEAVVAVDGAQRAADVILRVAST